MQVVCLSVPPSGSLPSSDWVIEVGRQTTPHQPTLKHRQLPRRHIAMPQVMVTEVTTRTQRRPFMPDYQFDRHRYFSGLITDNGISQTVGSGKYN